MDMFVGIDLAIAKRKRLPICVVVRSHGRLEPLPLLKTGVQELPRGSGNAAIIDEQVATEFAEQTLAYLKSVERAFDGRICGVAIDAPSSPAISGRRACELAMDALGISCFATPTQTGFETIKTKVRSHLAAGGPENRIPHANQLWMLAGFKLFEVLEAHYTCLEVFPKAIVQLLGAATVHKSKKEGLTRQLEAIARLTGWDDQVDALKVTLADGVGAPLHDQVDALMCAWVASCYPDAVTAFGSPPDDVIWLPDVSGPTTQPQHIAPSRMKQLVGLIMRWITRA